MTGAPVVIVGAGPVGVTAALLLARHGVPSLLLERHREVYPLPRAVAADDEARRILQAAGIDVEFTAVARPARGLRLLDARHRVIAEFRRLPYGHHGYPQTSMFDQPELERLLREALTRHPECELRTGAEVTSIKQDEEGGPVQVTYRDADDGQHTTVVAAAVLGCDGAGSRTREAIGAGWEDLHFEEDWTVVDVRTTAPVRGWGGVDQVCDPHHPATFMRIAEDRYRWEFRLPDGAPDLPSLLSPWTDATSTPDFKILRQANYTFRARLADRWRRGRVFLLGDAAHQTPPFIGQGLCTGLRDAHNLTWKLARALLRQGADDRLSATDDRLLDTYESERRPHARRAIRLAVTVGWAMTGGQDRAAALRRAAVGAVCRVPGVTRPATRDLVRPLPPGPLVTHARLAGTHCPQPWVRGDDGTHARLDDVLANSFAVLTAVPLPPTAQALADALDARVTRANATLTTWLRRGGADAVLLRPDRVVLDAIPRHGVDFTATRTWSPLLCTTAT
ncbi:bifunctional 3-(3-hydroxy-phenyl)propionate/3-hydroxycinnamic acid hydroxylase MhpA [Streptomyces flavalbus]|uniref:Bifunctional 3-(3-hydroxy-phenyl)propionate/3-hydroxycinnamic acid hydroxylase n=1 Tax=Streptomyces flavalbus TaxID=2665155 RepID=A0ABW2WFE4_9ACTN